MKQIVAFLVLTFYVSLLFAQTYKPVLDLDYNGVSVHIVPVTMIDIFSPRLRLGAEYRFKDNYSLSLDLGGMVNKHKDYSLFEARPEFRYYFDDVNKVGLSPYMALELFYIFLDKNLKDSYYYPDTEEDLQSDIPKGDENLILEEDKEVWFDKAHLIKYKYGMDVKGGVKVMLNNHLSLDVYAGLGYANKIVKYKDVELSEETKEIPVDNFLLFFSDDRVEEDVIIPHVTLGFKLGYRF